MGFEPTASSLPSRRAPTCATAPPKVGIDFIPPKEEASNNRAEAGSLETAARGDRYSLRLNQVYPIVNNRAAL